MWKASAESKNVMEKIMGWVGKQFTGSGDPEKDDAVDFCFLPEMEKQNVAFLIEFMSERF